MSCIALANRLKHVDSWNDFKLQQNGKRHNNIAVTMEDMTVLLVHMLTLPLHSHNTAPAPLPCCLLASEP